MVGTRVPRNTAKIQTEQGTTQRDKLYMNSIHFLEIGKAGLSRFRDRSYGATQASDRHFLSAAPNGSQKSHDFRWGVLVCYIMGVARGLHAGNVAVFGLVQIKVTLFRPRVAASSAASGCSVTT